MVGPDEPTPPLMGILWVGFGASLVGFVAGIGLCVLGGFSG